MKPVVRQVSRDQILVEAGGMRVLAQSECPHRKGRLRFGLVNPRRMSITCPLHHSSFDLRTGEQLTGPACGSLQVEVLPEDVVVTVATDTEGEVA